MQQQIFGLRNDEMSLFLSRRTIENILKQRLPSGLKRGLVSAFLGVQKAEISNSWLTYYSPFLHISHLLAKFWNTKGNP